MGGTGEMGDRSLRLFDCEDRGGGRSKEEVGGDKGDS